MIATEATADLDPNRLEGAIAMGLAQLRMRSLSEDPMNVLRALALLREVEVAKCA